MGEVGVEVVERVLPELRQQHKIDLVIAQAENVSEGKGITVADFRRLQKTGIDFCTGGNWTLHQPEIIQLLENKDEPIIRPASFGNRRRHGADDDRAAGLTRLARGGGITSTRGHTWAVSVQGRAASARRFTVRIRQKKRGRSSYRTAQV